MLRGMKVCTRVPVGRRVAATDVAALKAHAQVQPLAASLQAFLATLRLRLHFLYVSCNMTTDSLRHRDLLGDFVPTNNQMLEHRAGLKGR
jgi:hypothetical protein